MSLTKHYAPLMIPLELHQEPTQPEFHCYPASEVDALSQDCAVLREEINDKEEELDEARCEIARLSSPPQERAEILERHAARLDFLRTHNYPLSSDPPGSDIDTLLGDCAAWRNALAVSQAKCEGLEGALKLARKYAGCDRDCGGSNYRNGQRVSCGCGFAEALPTIIAAATNSEVVTRHDGLRTYVPLAASQQHTAGGTEPAVLRLSGHQVNILREFTDGDESFPVLIQRLPERTACNGERMQEGLYVWSEDHPDEGVLLLPEQPEEQHTAGSGDECAEPEPCVSHVAYKELQSRVSAALLLVDRLAGDRTYCGGEFVDDIRRTLSDSEDETGSGDGVAGD